MSMNTDSVISNCKIVNVGFWRDRRVRRLDGFQGLIAFYCLTSPEANDIGLYEFSIDKAAKNCGFTSESGVHSLRRYLRQEKEKVNPTEHVRQSLRTVCDVLRWQFDEAASVLFIPTWFKHHPSRVTDVDLASALKAVDELPPTYLLAKFVANTRFLRGAEYQTFISFFQKKGIIA